MQHLIISAHLGVLVFECVEAMWTGCDNALELDLIEELNILFGQHLEDVFMPQPPGGFTAAGFVEAQYTEIDAHLVEHYFHFGEKLGISFQIQDDILGAWGDEKLTGKSAANDIRDRKKTLPVVMALNQTAAPDAALELARLYLQPSPFNGEQVQRALDILEQVGAREYAEGLAEHYYVRALRHLDETGIDNAAQDHLRQIAASLLRRET